MERTFSVGPPVAGEHTEEILSELGLDPGDRKTISDMIPAPRSADTGEDGVRPSGEGEHNVTETSVHETVDGSSR
jgi:hypothetical protein